jgi:hypothetical protein
VCDSVTPCGRTSVLGICKTIPNQARRIRLGMEHDKVGLTSRGSFAKHGLDASRGVTGLLISTSPTKPRGVRVSVQEHSLRHLDASSTPHLSNTHQAPDLDSCDLDLIIPIALPSMWVDE